MAGVKSGYLLIFEILCGFYHPLAPLHQVKSADNAAYSLIAADLFGVFADIAYSAVGAACHYEYSLFGFECYRRIISQKLTNTLILPQ